MTLTHTVSQTRTQWRLCFGSARAVSVSAWPWARPGPRPDGEESGGVASAVELG